MMGVQPPITMDHTKGLHLASSVTFLSAPHTTTNKTNKQAKRFRVQLVTQTYGAQET